MCEGGGRVYIILGSGDSRRGMDGWRTSVWTWWRGMVDGRVEVAGRGDAEEEDVGGGRVVKPYLIWQEFIQIE